jgi:hypothetical protein
MKNDKIRIFRKVLQSLLRDVNNGRFAIPKLQREFVWDGTKAAKLIDSIFQGMPIGVILIWETPKYQRLYLRQQYHVLPPFNDSNPMVWFLIDGQQRISVLHHVREGGIKYNARGKEIDFSHIVFSLKKEKDNRYIRYRSPLPRRYIPLCQILHPQWRLKLKDLTHGNLQKVKDCREKILKFGMYLMLVKMKNPEVRECFLRINTQGMKVTTADAIITKAGSLNLRDIVHEVRQHFNDSFRGIEAIPIIWALASMSEAIEARGQKIEQVIKRMENEAESDKKRRKAMAKEWTRLIKCFGKAVDYLKQNFMVLSRDFLYSDYMVSMLALFFFWNGRGPDSKQKNEIRKWFWATAVGSRYSGRNFLRCIPNDAQFFNKLAENPNTPFRFTQLIEKNDIRGTQYAGHSGISSAFYSLLLKHKPVNILDDGLNEIPLEKYSTQANRKDRHHIFSRHLMTAIDVPVNRYNSICNICLLTAEENQMIGNRRPRLYLGEISHRKRLFLQKMKRHLIPVDPKSGVWNQNIKQGFNRFIKAREGIICRNIESEAGIKLFRKET